MSLYGSRFGRAFVTVLALGLTMAIHSAALGQTTWHVDQQNGSDLNDGSTWPTAFATVGKALDLAQAGHTVKVAKGTYKPGTAQSDSFDVRLEVVLEGGYRGCPGGDCTNADDRDFVLYETILSGDIDDNDHNSPAEDPGDIVGANSWHVLTIINFVDPDPDFFLTVVDGFTITAGNANRAELTIDRVGGGALVRDLETDDIPFVEGPKFQDCIFVGNRSEDVGGALACVDVGVEVRDCLILNNETMGGADTYWPNVLPIGGGGGIAAIAPFVLVNSRIVGNTCVGNGGGGGVSAWQDGGGGGKNVLASCLFAGNEALTEPAGRGGYGGGARIQTGEVMNCAFIANVAYFGGLGAVFSGGGLRADDTVAVYLSSFYKNDAPNGGGGGVAFTSSSSTITNSIAWENTDLNNPGDWRQQIFGPQNGPCPTWSNVQDWECDVCVGCQTLRNICADPYFSDPEGSDDMLGTEDDHLHLRLDSPSIDKGSDDSPLHVPLDSGDVNDDGNPSQELPWDLPGSTRKFDAGVGTGNKIDQGAYEEQCLACPWDLNGDGTVGSVDLLILQVNWGALCHHANFQIPDTVGSEDLIILLIHWGDCPTCSEGASGGSSPELEAATQVMGFAGSEAYGQWLRDEATDQQAEVSVIVLYALLHD